jgi:hypothetical protein
VEVAFAHYLGLLDGKAAHLPHNRRFSS